MTYYDDIIILFTLMCIIYVSGFLDKCCAMYIAIRRALFCPHQYSFKITHITAQDQQDIVDYRHLIRPPPHQASQVKPLTRVKHRLEDNAQ